MANPNPEIWGAPSTWVDAPHANGTTGELAESLKIATPKCANFGGESNVTRLYTGIQEGRITANEPLDLTICPCGQDPTVSAFGKIAILNENKDGSLVPRVIERSTPCNWFFYDQKLWTSPDVEPWGIKHQYTYSFNRGMKYDQWSPYAVVDNSYNPNMRISPYVFWYLRSILLSIEVYCITDAAASGMTGTWRTLDDWKTNHNTDKICGLRYIQRAVNSVNTTTMTVSYINSGLSNNNFSGQVGILDAFTGILNNDTQTDTTFYSFAKIWGNNRYTMIFAPTYQTGENININILPCYNMFDGQELKRQGNSSNGYYYYYEIPYSTDTYEKIMKITACFGCFFTPTSRYEFNYDMLDNDVYLPIIAGDGVTHGEYTHGADNANNPLYEMGSLREIDYEPSAPHDPNTYSNTTGFNSLSSSAAMTRRYVLNAANVEKLGDDLWTICNDLATGGDFEYFDGKLKDEFLTTNPIDSIVSLQRFPFNIPHTFAPSKSAVRLGKTDGSAQGYLTNNPFNTIVFRGIDIFARFGNCFLDYEPFTSYELYVPFCGTTKIRAADILGHKLNLNMQIDLMTGNCTAYIMADQLVIETLNGSCGVDMQLSGIQTATVAANLYNGILGQQQAKTSMIAQAVSALLPSNWVNPVGYAAKGEQAETTYKQATYAIEHTETPVHSIGAASALLAWVQEFNARLIIYYPEGDVVNSAIPPSFRNPALAAFGHLKGFATVEPGKVSDFQIIGKSAFLQGDILADNIPCTQSERNKIKAFFAEGVYLPPIS